MVLSTVLFPTVHFSLREVIGLSPLPLPCSPAAAITSNHGPQCLLQPADRRSRRAAKLKQAKNSPWMHLGAAKVGMRQKIQHCWAHRAVSNPKNNNTKNYTSYSVLLYSIVLVQMRSLFTMLCSEHSKIAFILTHAIGRSHLFLQYHLIMVWKLSCMIQQHCPYT